MKQSETGQNSEEIANKGIHHKCNLLFHAFNSIYEVGLLFDWAIGYTLAFFSTQAKGSGIDRYCCTWTRTKCGILIMSGKIQFPIPIIIINQKKIIFYLTISA